MPGVGDEIDAVYAGRVEDLVAPPRVFQRVPGAVFDPLHWRMKLDLQYLPHETRLGTESAPGGAARSEHRLPDRAIQAGGIAQSHQGKGVDGIARVLRRVQDLAAAEDHDGL